MSKVIHHACKTFFPIKGGIEVVVDSICKATATDGLQFATKVLSCSEVDEQKGKYAYAYAYANVKLIRSFGDVLSLPMAPKMVPEIIRSLKTADVLFVHYPFPIIDFAIGLFGGFGRSKIIVYWHSNIVSQRLSKWLVSPFTWLMLKRADVILVATPPMIENSNLLSLFRNKIEILPYSLRSSDDNVEVSDGDYFIAIGRHVAYKGFDFLIDAMASNNHQLKIVGDGPLFDKHQTKINQLGLGGRVTLLRGVSNSEKEKLLGGAIALVLPSVYPSEAFALVQLEAMRYGKPIINTSLASGVPWVARDGKEAITVKPACAESLTIAMDQINDDKPRRTVMAGYARKRYVERFCADVFDKEILRLIESV